MVPARRCFLLQGVLARVAKRPSITPGLDPRAAESQESWGGVGDNITATSKSPHSSHLAVDITYRQNSPPMPLFVNSSDEFTPPPCTPQIKEVWNVPRQGCLHLATQLPGAESLVGPPDTPISVHWSQHTALGTGPASPSLSRPFPHCAVPLHALLEPLHHWGARGITAKPGV